MEAYCNAVRRLEDKFDRLELNHIARKYNDEVDELAKIASGRTAVPPNVFAHDLAKPFVDFKSPAEAIGVAPEPSGAATTKPSTKDPSTKEPEAMDTNIETTSMDEAEAMEIDEAPPPRDWHTQYLDWMIRGVLPSDHAQAQRVARRAKSFVLIDDELFGVPNSIITDNGTQFTGKKLLAFCDNYHIRVDWSAVAHP
ncbi:uncharacterized protein LOC120685079 [Panicum virgatum]|uniref:uncharacterized protein LOC120685079 n=1 Tax=Panicum virgatum TaxID=38727 RepID=UPI0019D67178|nr:uncharacterized protein LOC120685079 [Panicum virgatum]